MNAKHFFLTGLPSIGKTTALLRIIQSLDPAFGFVTQAIELDGKRIGLNIITTDYREFTVASTSPASAHRIGKYFVNITALDGAVQQVLDRSRRTKYIYVDEIGTMYCQSALFISTVRTMLESHVVIGVIARRGHPFIDEIHQRPDCCFMEVTADHRDDVPNRILEKIKPL